MDFKGCFIFVGSIIAGSVNEILTSLGIAANIFYIGYQIYTHHKKNKDE